MFWIDISCTITNLVNIKLVKTEKKCARGCRQDEKELNAN